MSRKRTISQWIEETPPFDPDKRDYTSEELDDLATKWLFEDKVNASKFNRIDRLIASYLETVQEADTREIANALQETVGAVYSSLSRLHEREVVLRIREPKGKGANTLPTVWASNPEHVIEDAGPVWLTPFQLKARRSREILTNEHAPDPAYASGLYKRPYREGAKKSTSLSD